MPSQNSDRALPDLIAGLFDGDARPFRKRLMSKPGKVVIASQHYPPDSTTTADIISKMAGHLGGRAAGSGAFGDARLRDKRYDRFEPAYGRRDQKPDTGKIGADQARCSRNILRDAHIHGAAEEIAARRRRGHRHRPLHVALCGCRRGQIEARTIGADHARPLSRCSRDGRSPEARIDTSSALWSAYLEISVLPTIP
jgi:hypothetical protein